MEKKKKKTNNKDIFNIYIYWDWIEKRTSFIFSLVRSRSSYYIRRMGNTE